MVWPEGGRVDLRRSLSLEDILRDHAKKAVAHWSITVSAMMGFLKVKVTYSRRLGLDGEWNMGKFGARVIGSAK
jgi:hypothetical protein